MRKILAILVVLGMVAAIAFVSVSALAPPLFKIPQPNTKLSLITEPDDGIEPMVELIQDATKSIDLVMYDLEDQQVERALASASAHGVAVRVLLNKGYHGTEPTSGKPANEAAYEYLQAHNVEVHWTPASFALTHEKSLVIDDAVALVMGFNLTPTYYATSRDFGIEDTDSRDVAAMESVFNADWAGGLSTFSQNPPTGVDLVWSPHAESELIALIASARHSILIYNEEMSDGEVIQALEGAAKRSVSVNVIMTYESSWKSAFQKLSAAGVHLTIYPAKASLYIHAKMIVVDGTVAFIGSQNFSATSLNDNRELGILITSPSIIDSLERTFAADWTGATL